MSTPPLEPLMTVYDDKLLCRGFVLNRGRNGHEAFDRDIKSLGRFPDRETAIAAVLEAKPATS